MECRVRMRNGGRMEVGGSKFGFVVSGGVHVQSGSRFGSVSGRQKGWRQDGGRCFVSRRTVKAVMDKKGDGIDRVMVPAWLTSGDVPLPFAAAVDEFVNSPQVEGGISLLVLLQCVSFAIESLSIDIELRQALSMTETGITMVFLTEYLLRWYGKGLKAKYLLSKLMIIDLVAILPGFFSMASMGINLQFIRLLRVWRIFRLQRILQREEFNKIFGITSAVSSTNLRVAEIVVTVFSILYVSSALLYEAEVEVNPTIDNFFDAFYFTLVTLTTVGFGDITPVTPLGKFLVSCSVLTGVFLIPYQLGRLAEAVLGDMGMTMTQFMESECNTCGTKQHLNDASFCRICGTRLVTNQWRY